MRWHSCLRFTYSMCNDDFGHQSTSFGKSEGGSMHTCQTNVRCACVAFKLLNALAQDAFYPQKLISVCGDFCRIRAASSQQVRHEMHFGPKGMFKPQHIRPYSFQVCL